MPRPSNLPFGLYALTARSWSPRGLPMPRLSRWVYLGYAAAWLAYAVLLRNPPIAPLSWFDIPNLT
jgi:hypothetical protein